MKANLLMIYCFTCISVYVRVSIAGTCKVLVQCPPPCITKQPYKIKCGYKGWKRCTRERYVYTTCPFTCHREECCAGFTGTNCSEPLCFGSKTCPNGGTCVQPDVCGCRPGFSGSKCDDVNECSSNNGDCQHTCKNEIGSHICECRSGYTLNSDRWTCSDVNECLSNNGGCQHICKNVIGSHGCECRSGYILNGDRQTCTDIDECASGSANCAQTCKNTPGSFTCYCRQGYTLDINGLSCIEIDECSTSTARCTQMCHNSPGSYRCSCNAGYTLLPDALTCEDNDECKHENGQCEQICSNIDGSFTCACNQGFELADDGTSCNDIDECAEKVDGCSHICTNGVGSYTCSCRDGFELVGKQCLDKDDCAGIGCLNGGACKDGLNSYTCQCQIGFTGQHCENDINECTFLNGGCQDTCTNLNGNFECDCSGNKTLERDGKTCTGTDISDSVFKRHKLPRQLLPRGCATLPLTRCKDGKNIEVFLSSTSAWFKLNSNSNVVYTHGIVFVEVNELSLPISLNGAVVTLGTDDFEINLGTNKYTPNEGIPLAINKTDDCISFDFTAPDIFEFVSSVSFLKTYFDRLVNALPPWLGFSSSPFSALDVNDLKTDLVYGHKMEDATWCSGAPVIPNHLYSVFRFSSEFSLSIYGNAVNISTPLNGRKFCLIVDICQNYGGSVFLMIPEESRDLLLAFEVFKDLNDKQGLTVHPRGIGVSLFKGVNVHYQETALQLWNGDTKFTYPVFDRADLWIGGDVTKKTKELQIQGSADVFVSVPHPVRMLTAVFIDEWNVLAQIRASATPTLTFKLFKKVYDITFVDMVQASVDMYMSIGGTQDRQWCGESANTPGVFLSSSVTINPFQTVPILEDWIFNIPSELYAFLTSDPSSRITDDLKIDILEDIIQINDVLKRFKRYIDETVSSFETLLTDATKAIIDKLKGVIIIFENSSDGVIGQGNVFEVINLLTSRWDDLNTLESTVKDFLDETEHFVDDTKDKFIGFIKSETKTIKIYLDNAIIKLRNQVLSAATDYSGFGLKFTTSLNFFKLKLIGIDVEFVYSVDSLLQCSRFDKVKQLLAGERAGRFIGRLSRGLKLGYFLKLDVGAGIGGAMSIDTDKLIIQLTAYVNMLGMKVTGDVFISRSGLYLYIEGNIWNLFLAQIDVSAEVGNEWYELTYTLKGRFVAKSRKRRQTQTVSTSFNGSYLDALTNVVGRISDEAQKRISQAQNALSKAQKGLTKAQNWLDDKKKDVRNANMHFDNAVTALEKAKDKLEAAKGPFNKAIEKLTRAQQSLDNICKIRTCSKICIPGIKCRICFKRIWGVRIPFPCCRITNCMIRLPNLICEAANLICRGIRTLAFAALELAKLLVKAPLLALDIAKVGVSVAQFAVDKSRIVLVAAENLIDLATFGLQAAKSTLEAAKQGLEFVKRAIGVAADILQFVLQYGLKNIIDIRNCGFDVQLSTTDLPVFDVSCEVNAFKLGWRKVGIRINFKNILQSLWQAAKATINALVKSVGGIFSGRKKREIEYDSSSHLHILLRKIRQADSNNANATEKIINDPVSVINETLGFNENVIADDMNRILLYKQKCELYNTTSAFLIQGLNLLHELVNETDTLHDINAELQIYTTSKLEENMDLSTAGVNSTYLMENYNVSMEEIEAALQETKSTFQSDTFINELSETSRLSSQIIKSNLESVSSKQLLSSWEMAVGNNTHIFFNDDQCQYFSDCIFYAISALYEIHIEENYENINKSKDLIRRIENDILEIMNNSALDITDINRLSTSVVSALSQLESNIVFCKSPPFITTQPQNVTVYVGRSVEFLCNASSPDSSLKYSWYKDGDPLVNQIWTSLRIWNASVYDEGYYECIVGNVVANITSDRAFLTVTEDIDGHPEVLKAECIAQGCPMDQLSCYIPHPETCLKYIQCASQQSGGFLAYSMKCGFGTMWPQHQGNEASVCVRAESVDCKLDPCQDSSVVSYDHEDDNLRTYWRCDKERSIPDCCPHHHRYDATARKCVQDKSSIQKCALRNDDTCEGHAVRAIYVDDGNCRTYEECIDRLPHPVCCPENMEYDVFTSKCVNSITCNDTCPDEFIDCDRESIDASGKSYRDTKTYRVHQCPSSTRFDQDHCDCIHDNSENEASDCSKTTKPIPGEPSMYTLIVYDKPINQSCAPGTVFDSISCGCIFGSNPVVTPPNECSKTKKPVPEEPSMYTIMVHGKPINQSCAPGTVFDPTSCGCIFGSNPVVTPQNECSKTKKPVPGEPSIYTIMVHGKPINQSCAPGTVFDPTSCGCIVGSNPVVTPPNECSKTKKPVPGEPSMYTIMVHGKPINQSCAPGTVFDPTSCGCIVGSNPVVTPPNECFKTKKSVPGEPSMYTIMVHGKPINQSCAPGTVFNPTSCGCIFGSYPVVTPPNDCSAEIQITLPYIENVGLSKAAVMMLKDGDIYVSRYGNMSEFWNGSDGLYIPYYYGTTLSVFYVEITLRPSRGENKQVILSSCKETEESKSTLELASMGTDYDGGRFTLQVRSLSGKGIDIETSFMYDITYTYRIIYNGNKIAVQQIPEDSATIDPSVPTAKEEKILSGIIDIGRYGLRFASCPGQPNVTSFIGKMEEIIFTRCLSKRISMILG